MLPQIAKLMRAVAGSIAAALLALPGPSRPAEADEQHTFCGKTVDQWIDVLRDKASRDREGAAWTLSYIGPDARDAIPELIDMLRDDRLARTAEMALGRIGPDASRAVPLLIERFTRMGCQHLTGAGRLGFDPGAKDALVRVGAPAVPALLDVLNGPDRAMRVCAAEALGEIGPAARAAVPALVHELHAEKPLLDDGVSGALRFHATVALGRIGPDAKPAVTALNVLLDQAIARSDTDYHDEWPIVEALDRIGEPPVTKLVQGFHREGGSWRGTEMAKLGTRARPAILALRRVLSSPQLRVRIDAAVALTAIDPPSPDAVKVLTAALNPFQEEAYEVPEALGRLGPAAEAALPSLIGLAERDFAASSVMEALARIDTEGKVCVPVLVAALKHDYDASAAARALGLLGPRARQAVPALTATLSRKFSRAFGNEGDPLVEAAKAIRRIDPEAKSAIPAPIDAVKLRHGGPAGHVAENDETDDESAAAIIRVIGGFGSAAKDSIPVLIEILKSHGGDDDRWQARREAALALGRIGPDAVPAVPVLRKLVEEGPPPRPRGMVGAVPQVSDAAVVALLHLAPDGQHLAATWAERSGAPERKAFVLGAMGQPSFEANALTRFWLEVLARAMRRAAEEGDESLYIEEYLARLGDLGIGGALAVPRLNEFRRHRNPFIRLWAGETLDRISKANWSPVPKSGSTNTR